jgi:DNA-binding PadR family transcriptional regulator
MSGYELGQNVRASVGHIWSESYGQIYPNLKKLAANGLVTVQTETQKGKPDRNIYSITPAGRDQLLAWLKLPPQPEIPRNEMLLKVFFGSRIDPAILIAYVEQMVATHQALLDKFSAIDSLIEAEPGFPADIPFWRISARYGQFEMQAHLQWAEETLAILRKLQPQKS